MTGLDRLGRDALPAIAALCQRSLEDVPTGAELAGALFDDEQPAIVRGDPDVGVVVTVRDPDDATRGFVRLLVVDPGHRRGGHGRALLAAAEDDLDGASTITVGADAPFYLYPGVESALTPMLCLLERCRYQRVDTAFNMRVDLDALPPDPPGPVAATEADAAEVGPWLQQHWPNWRPEAMRALRNGTLLVSRDDQGISGFCAYDVNRGGLLGPIASRPDLIGKGAGAPLLTAALHRMRATGRDHIEVAWVGPIVPYARAGGRVSRVFFVYRKQRAR